MADGSVSADFMNMSDSAHNGTKMEIDGFPSNTLVRVTVEESIETKEWVLPSNTASGSVDQVIGVQPVAGVTNFYREENTVLTENASAPVQQDELSQDDMFSFDELSAVDSQAEQQVMDTAMRSADVATSLSGHGYEPYLSSGEIDGTMPVSGERSEMGPHETEVQDISLKFIGGSVDLVGQQTNGHLCDKGKGEDLEGTAPLNKSSVDIETNNGPSLIEEDAFPGQELIGTSTLEGPTHENLQFEDAVKTDVHLTKGSGEINDQQTNEVFEKAHTLTENHLQTESMTNDAYQLNEAHEEVNLSTGMTSQNESVKYDTDQLTSELPAVVVTSTEESLRSSVATDDSNDENKQPKHFTNNAIINSSECCSEDLPKEVECQSYLKQSQMTRLNEQMSVSDEKYLETSAMKTEEDTHLEQSEIVVKNDKEGSRFTQEIEMPLMKEEEVFNKMQPEKIPDAMQTALGNDLQSKSEDINQIPTFKKIESQERQVCLSDSSAGTNEPSANVTQKEKSLPDMLKQTVITKEDIVSVDANPLQEEEQSKNVQQIGNVVENMSSHMPIFHGTIESHVEHIEDRDEEQRQLELLKGRKVAKRFGKRKYMGEVIGYDPASKWFKVLYEDGDEEELEKHEVDAILILHGEEASVSRKRQLSPTSMDHEESNRSERKSRKVDGDGAPGRQRKTKTLKDETPGPHQLSNTKKRKSSAAKSRGKSKSPKTTMRKGRKGTGKSTSTKKSVGKKTTAKKSQSSQIKGQQKSDVKEKSSKNEGKQDSANQHVDDVTRKLKYGSTKKKTPTKAKQKAKEITKKGKEAETPQDLMTTKPEVDAPGRKRKAVTELQSGSSTVSTKRTKRSKVVNDLESPPEKKTQSIMISEDTSQLPSQAEEDKAQTAIPPSTGKKGGRGTDLVGRKVKKDFGRKLYGGEVVGYKVFYKVKYEDGDSEDLTWKELESILLPEEEQHQGTKHSSARSKGKKKN
ncbi:hypothetical protein SUGI_0493450 [Cryptomeria japonica]|uniref:uncharacterized protein LOC131045836 isoform X2 n=1 Tax=Cryptomeria japonica TaxID=3369 RepID=UPI002408AA31|nr:uncharacterized protein LOC131045836 isoform X2 [Cryptomeria japonica]GLJ25777.1 hypothetical protein SUGI_0493450 [Cryptomeria japonica]